MCALLLAWPSSRQMLGVVSSLGLSVPPAFHVNSAHGFLLESGWKFFLFLWTWWVELRGAVTTSADHLRSLLRVGVAA